MCGEWLSLSRKIITSSTSTNDEDEAVLAREEGSEENHEYFKFLQNEKEGSLPCAASLFHSHTPQVVPVKRYYTHRTCHSWSPSVSDAAKCVIMFGIVQSNSFGTRIVDSTQTPNQ